MNNKKFLSLGGLLCAVALFIVINLAAAPLLRSSRVDLTQHHLYTLSHGTRDILKNLKEPITLQFYWSKGTAEKFPGLQSYADQVREMLDEYAVVAGSKLKLQTIDPEPFSAAEDDAVRYGLKGVAVGNQESLYFGLVALARDGAHKVIPFFQQSRQKFLEYDLTETIYNLAHPQKPTVGLISAIPMNGEPMPGSFSYGQPWMIMQALHTNFDVRVLGTRITEIPKGIDTLMVVDPEHVSAATLYAIDQFVLNGGHALVFTDPMSESLPGYGEKDQTPEAAKLLAAWGIKLAPGEVVGDMGAAMQVAVGNSSQSRVVVYPPWLSLEKKQMNRKEVVTSEIGRLTMATPGALMTVPGAGTTIVPLVHSTSDAMLIPWKTVSDTEKDPGELLADFKGAGHPFDLAVRITGKTRTAFPKGVPAEPAKSKGKAEKKDAKSAKPTPQLMASNGPINVIVVADSDLLEDRFWVQTQNFFGRQIAVPMASNADFTVNSLDQLGGGTDLISVRSRGSYQRPFTLVNRLRKQAEEQYQTKEQALLAELKSTQNKLNELQRQRHDAGSATTLNAAQEKELKAFRLEMVRTREKLRAVRYNLRKNIASLETTLKAFNIFFIPLLIGFAAFLVWVLRRTRNRGYPR